MRTRSFSGERTRLRVLPLAPSPAALRGIKTPGAFRSRVFGGGAEQGTRGRVRSPIRR